MSIHADRTEKLVGIRAEDIHKWIDCFFDAEGFQYFIGSNSAFGFSPYDHRKHRHCAEALEDAYREFEGKYTKEQIRAVFECHLRDDYDGFIPLLEDFESGMFAEKYHENDGADAQEKILSEQELSEYFKGKVYALRDKDTRKLSAAFYWRIVWPVIIAAVLFAASAFTIIVPVFRNSMMKQKREMIRELTSTAASAIEFYIRQEQSGELSLEEAQRLAADEVAELRYGVDGKDYFWITDMHPRMVMHPYRPELIGQDLTNYTDREDRSGIKLFAESVDMVKSEGKGYLEYRWQWMDDPSRSEPKLSFVRGIPEWNWVIGTGIYIHDVEQEIDRLSHNLLLADGIIAVVLLALLINVVYQSRRIELERKRAEDGLLEAKDRYRALVEGANEGYVLEVGGETIYANRAMCRMSGYSEAELARLKAWDLLDLEAEENQAVEAHLKDIYDHKASSGEFEARLLTKSGKRLDVQVSTSRIFFSEKNGHVISFVEISRDRQQILSAFYRSEASPDFSAPAIDQKIEASTTKGQVIQTLKELPAWVRALSDQGVHPGILRETIGSAYDATIHRFIQLTLEEKGAPAVPFAFVSLGSNARHEMTMFSDQDNALIFADVPDEDLVMVRHQFLALADEVCTTLKKAGYPRCSGGLMAANPKWCLSLSEWKKHLRKWILKSTPENILEVNMFFDLRCAFGAEALVGELRNYIQQLVGKTPEFFMHYAKNCLAYKAPVGLRGRMRTERHGEQRTINLKECLTPIETFARLYALRHDISAPGTLERLHQLFEKEVLKEESYRELVFVFDYLWKLRFFNQIEANTALSTNSDDLDVAALTEIERENLQSILARIPIFQTKLSYDFLGTQV
ncbi:MAG: cache domain-containing protein [Pontiellaceae bacterium]|nr:cache domain-containing protein [Pontiellaceae bacterium]